MFLGVRFDCHESAVFLCVHRSKLIGCGGRGRLLLNGELSILFLRHPCCVSLVHCGAISPAEACLFSSFSFSEVHIDDRRCTAILHASASFELRKSRFFCSGERLFLSLRRRNHLGA